MPLVAHALLLAICSRNLRGSKQESSWQTARQNQLPKNLLERLLYECEMVEQPHAGFGHQMDTPTPEVDDPFHMSKRPCSVSRTRVGVPRIRAADGITSPQRVHHRRITDHPRKPAIIADAHEFAVHCAGSYSSNFR